MAKPARTTFQVGDASDAVSGFSLLAGGPLYNVARRCGLAAPPAGFVRLGIVIALFTWVPLLVLAPLGRDDTAISFLHSLGTHARLLVAIALFFVAEAWFDKRSREAVRTLVDSRLVRAEQLSAFRSALLEATRWRDAWVVEAAVVVITLSFILAGPRSDLPRAVSTWRTTAEGSLTPAGWWYAMVSFPVFQFLLWRWGARMLIWWRLLWRINRLDLRLPPAHPDLAAGLGSFGEAHLTLAPLSVGVSTVLAATFAEDILYAGADVSRFALPLAGAICATVSLIVAPLLTFAPRLIRLRQDGLLEYGTLAADYVHAFDDKWIRQKAWQREPMLGSADVQSLADLANSFDLVRSMRFVPFSLFQVLLVVGAAALPALPLALFIVPADELILKALGAIFKV
jgi:hypothetical protein